MIVYYNHNTGDITGLGWNLIPALTDPYIETEDPIVLKFLTDKEKHFKYKIQLIDTADVIKAQIVPKKSSETDSYVPTFSQRAVLVPISNNSADITIEQHTDSLIFKFNKLAVDEWQTKYENRACVVVASATGSPYYPVWSASVKLSDVVDFLTTVSYTGPEDVRLFLSIPFGSISHKVIQKTL